VRVCIAGGGLAGSLLAWRLAQLPGIRADLLLGHDGGRDATGASGGAVRGYESLPSQRQLALASMAELLASPVLRQWGDYRQTGFVYLPGDEDDLATAVAQIEQYLPGSAAIATAGSAFENAGGAGSGDLGPAWAGPPGAVAVVERQAGYIAPARMRDALLADLVRRGGTVVDTSLDAVKVPPAGPVRISSAAVNSEYDKVVLAAGAWTPGLLRANGLPAGGYRTKSIQYIVYSSAGWCPGSFADEATGLYGKPTADGGLLLGVPTTGWHAPPGRPAADPQWDEQALALATRLFPRLRLGPARTRVCAADCYCDPPVLSLRPVQAAAPGLFTFTGGSGSAAKTVLAASTQAAAALAGAASVS
jgi:glycine/D-amino acid oxidase-like deaminating enzyme